MRKTNFELGLGSIIQVDETQWCVRRWATSTSVLARCVTTSDEKEIHIDEITKSLSESQRGPQLDLNSIDDTEWEEAVYKYSKLAPCLKKTNRTRTDVKNIADELLMSVPTVYRWIEKIEEYGTISCLFRKRRADKGEKKLPTSIEDIICKVISEEFLTKLKKSPTAAYKEIKRLCRKEGLTPPSKATIINRIELIHPEEKARKRQGRGAALKFTAQKTAALGADFVHALWQIDHTEVDIELVDPEHRIAIGRPWITLAMDVYSRMVVGWYVSFDPPGTVGTGICIANAILPKTQWLIELGVSLDWPCYGKPQAIQADNAKEFRGNMLKRACNEHDVDLKFRPVKKPNYGAHIERLLGTLLTEIHNLEGTTFSNPRDKGEYDSAKHAVMTLEDFEKWLANLIVGMYHHRKHTELECPPIKKYENGIMGDDNTPGIGFLSIAADPEKLRMDFLPFIERTIQADGVVVDKIQYHEPVLDRWIGALDEKTKKLKRMFIFRRDPRNLSYLMFWDPEAKQYYHIPYRDTARPRISLWELQKIRSHLLKQGKKDVDEDTIFSAFEEMRRIEAESKTKTRKQLRENTRRQKHEEQVPSLRKSAADASMPSGKIAGSSSFQGKTIDFSKVKVFDEVEIITEK